MSWIEVPTWAKELVGRDEWIPTTYHPDDYNDLFHWLVNHNDVPPDFF
jgi:hypothetical protein